MSKVVFDSKKITSRTLLLSRIVAESVGRNITDVAFGRVRKEVNQHIPLPFQYFVLVLLDYEFIKNYQEIRIVDHDEDIPTDERITLSWHYLPKPTYRKIMEFISRHRLKISYLDGLKIITSQQWRFWLDEESSK